jgi:hypothetical protein
VGFTSCPGDLIYAELPKFRLAFSQQATLKRNPVSERILLKNNAQEKQPKIRIKLSYPQELSEVVISSFRGEAKYRAGKIGPLRSLSGNLQIRQDGKFLVAQTDSRTQIR